ncbi:MULTISPECIES: aminoacyl-tRNA deacylase [Ferrimonas]|uniref:aminoacyl-tRNA deacylase n=1 Tax=Ferrimonas TaxID=44011 RepID=UPI000407DAC5|nr:MULTISPECIES: YbaK/EbsC family protein [Ferrimonas]USD37368.1 YbaK/EbsC family protein [Ferrimonas sp. SCSIO 43195]
MGIAISISEYLNQHHIPFRVVSHPYSESALQSAISAGIPQQQVAKAVMLQDHQGRQLMAVIPADRRLRLKRLGELLERDLSLMPEVEASQTFPDCQFGALPALGQAYHVPVVFDEVLQDQQQVFFEAGDHQLLVQLSQRDFGRVMAEDRHGRFSVQPTLDYGQRRL